MFGVKSEFIGRVKSHMVMTINPKMVAETHNEKYLKEWCQYCKVGTSQYVCLFQTYFFSSKGSIIVCWARILMKSGSMKTIWKLMEPRLLKLDLATFIQNSTLRPSLQSSKKLWTMAHFQALNKIGPKKISWKKFV